MACYEMMYRTLALVGSCEHVNVEMLGPKNSSTFLE